MFRPQLYESGIYKDTHKFTGKEEDGTGLYYFGARYYDKSLGRFLSTDPVLNLSGTRYNIPDAKVNPGAALNLHNPQDLNPYVYCRNNPLRYIDPDGTAFYSVETDEPIHYKKVGDYLMGMAQSILKGKETVLPIYWKTNPLSGKELMRHGIWRTFFEAFTGLSGGGRYSYGKSQKTAGGQSYNLIYAQVPSTAQGEPVWLHPPFQYGSHKETGEDLIRVQFQTDKAWILKITGTLENVNTELHKLGYEVYLDKRNEYQIRENEVKN